MAETDLEIVDGRVRLPGSMYQTDKRWRKTNQPCTQVYEVSFNDEGEIDREAKIFTGEVIGLRSMITFQGRTPEEIEEPFRRIN